MPSQCRAQTTSCQGSEELPFRFHVLQRSRSVLLMSLSDGERWGCEHACRNPEQVILRWQFGKPFSMICAACKSPAVQSMHTCARADRLRIADPSRKR